MSSERESILNDITEHLRTVPGVAVVTRFDHRAIIGQLNEWPAICVVDLGDEVVKRDSRKNLERHLSIALVTVLSGSTEDAVAEEMADFQQLVKRNFYVNIAQNEYTADAYPVRMSPLAYVKVGSKVACQGLEFRILYVEDISKLFDDDVLPTE